GVHGGPIDVQRRPRLRHRGRHDGQVHPPPGRHHEVERPLLLPGCAQGHAESLGVDRAPLLPCFVAAAVPALLFLGRSRRRPVHLDLPDHRVGVHRAPRLEPDVSGLRGSQVLRRLRPDLAPARRRR
ncbi:unnamed protein product, partial [Ectocarpus sp. 6 AP-2014]